MDDFEATYRRYLKLTEGMTGEAVAELDGEVNQKLANRWKRGDLKQEPSAPKMAAMRRIVDRLDRGRPGEREMGILEAVNHIQAALDQLRRRLGQPEGEGPTPTRTTARGRAAGKASARKLS